MVSNIQSGSFTAEPMALFGWRTEKMALHQESGSQTTHAKGWHPCNGLAGFFKR